MERSPILRGTASTAPAGSQARMWPGIEETNEMLQARMTREQVLVGAPRRAEETPAAPPRSACPAPPQQSAPIRLSVWALSLGVALFALPVGALLAVLNLTRGENLRLTSQTAALTGMFVALLACGWAAAALGGVPSILP